MNKNNKNNEDFLKSVLKQETGFTTPENYFSEIEDRFSTFITEEKLPNNSAFKTPEGYFNNLEDVILSKVITPKKEVKVISLKQRIFKSIPYAAASVILFIGLNSYVFNSEKNISFDDLADTEIENWISNNTNLISDTDLTLAYTDINFDEDDLISSSISTDEIENYLSNEDVISLILENN